MTDRIMQSRMKDLTTAIIQAEAEIVRQRKRAHFWNIVLIVTLAIFLSVGIVCFILSILNRLPAWGEWLMCLPLPVFLSYYLSKRAEEEMEIMQTKVARMKRAPKDINTINVILEQKKAFILYLRDFCSGVHETSIPVRGSSVSGVANPFAWYHEYGKKSTHECITYFSGKYSLVFLDNDREKTLFSEGLIVYPTDDQWREVFVQLAKAATFIIIDYIFTNITNNIEQEINELMLLKRKNLLLVGTEKDLALLREKYVALCDNIYCRLAIKMKESGMAVAEQPYVDFSEYEKLTLRGPGH
jgi:hypothetical protein